MGSHRRIAPCLLVAVTLVTGLLSGSSSAQTSAGTILGVVTDSTGGVLKGVRVRIVNEGTALYREATTQGEGTFEIPLLPPGTYTIEAELIRDDTGAGLHAVPGGVLGRGQQHARGAVHDP